jgi:cytoplasmic iron level regulating protein YaaA (DUF328/UPF0246 family)
MKILLPPSEGKNEPLRRKALKLNTLVFHSDLTYTRTAVLKKHQEINFDHCDASATIYSGVLYQALNYSSLSKAAQIRANKSILIISAAFGALRLTDVIPYYKFKIDSAIWKKPLSIAMASLDDELIVDCRSSTYSTVWTPNPLNTVGIRVFKKVNGELKVVSHMSKLTRGGVTRFLISQSKIPKTPQELHQLLRQEFNCRLVASTGKKSWFIDVII